MFLTDVREMKIGDNRMERIKTKDRILLAALDLFSEKGYDQASIDLIAEAVGIKGPSIYAHYKGKEDILDSLIAMMEQKYDENFGNSSHLDKIPESLDEFKEDCLRRVGFTMKDPQIQKVRRFCAKEQYRNEKIAALTSKHQLTGNQEMYALMLEKMMEKKDRTGLKTAVALILLLLFFFAQGAIVVVTKMRGVG